MSNKPHFVSMDTQLLKNPNIPPSKRPWLNLYTEEFKGEWDNIKLINFATPTMIRNGNYLFPYQERLFRQEIIGNTIMYIKFLSLTRDKITNQFFRLTARYYWLCDKTTSYQTKGELYRQESPFCAFSRYKTISIGFSKVKQLIWKARKEKRIKNNTYRPVSKKTLKAIKKVMGEGEIIL